MALGLSTYAFFWQIANEKEQPISIEDMLEKTAELGGQVFQICDYPQIETYSPQQLQQIKTKAEQLAITLELGTKGILTEHLKHYLEIAKRLNVRVIRSMFNTLTHKPSLEEAEQLLRSVLPYFEEQNIQLCIETYEQVSTTNIMSVIDKIDHRLLGICLDPANCVAALEHPKEVIDKTASRVLNLHIKDFAFSRKDGWVGFSLAGAPLGTGLLDYDYLIQKINPNEKGINQIIEHWLPWQGDMATTCKIEDEWTRHNMQYLQNKQQ